MAIIVNTNVSALKTQKNLANATNSLNQALERMSTGLKINSAGDDAAGMFVATNLETQIRGSKIAQSNVATGINVLQTLEGSLDVINENLMRIRDLAVQASNGIYDTASMNAMRDEINARAEEIKRIQAVAKFNGIALFGGTLATGGLRLQVGANADAGANAITVDKKVFASIGDVGQGTTDFTVTKAVALIGSADTQLTAVATSKAAIGANQNRLSSAQDSLITTIENASAAKSTIMDADIAEESANYTKAQILQQTSSTLLVQANQLPALAINLIQ